VPDPRTLVIVGAGLAGAKAAEALREEGFDGRVVLVGDEPWAPYERPPLSKSYLTGDSTTEDAAVHPGRYYPEHEIELLTGARAVALDTAARRVRLADGAELAYDRLLLATGAVPRRPPIEGAELRGVRVLRTLAHARILRDRLRAGGPLAIVGAGWIGCEVAASARALGVEVTLIEAAATPLERVLGPRLGRFFAEVHREHGVRVLTGARIERIEGAGEAERIRLADGSTVECGTVLLGVGVAPDTALAAAAGLEVGDGVLVDEHLRTSAPGVFAAGDIAAVRGRGSGAGVRVEHWANALHQGAAAGRSMLDRGEPFDRLPSFFSDQYDLGLEYVGRHAAGDRLVVRGRYEDRRLLAFWLDAEDHLTAAMHVNEWGATEIFERLVGTGAPVDPARLADEAVPLEELVASAAGSES
jgi:3-phenylpropionate/trans-cinnamate dioxygenase ferredoxin reductase component